MFLNLYRFGSFSCSPAGTFSLFGVAASIGEAHPLPTDDIQTKEWLAFVNVHRLAISQNDISLLQDLRADAVFNAVSKNYELTDTLRKHFAISWTHLIPFLKTYNKRVLMSDYSKYSSYVFNSLLSLKWSAIFFIPSLLLPILLLRRDKSRSIAITTLTFLFIHIAHISVVSFFGVIHNRYYNLTLFPLAAWSMIIAVGFAIQIFKEHRKASAGRSVSD